MASKPCQHAKRTTGVVELDFSRQGTPNSPVYSDAVSFAVCDECGHIELYAMFHRQLCDWLRKS
jgi:hypothetical protein